MKQKRRKRRGYLRGTGGVGLSEMDHFPTVLLSQLMNSQKRKLNKTKRN